MKNRANSTHAFTHTCKHIIQFQKENHNISCIIKSFIILHKIIENHLQKKKKSETIFFLSLKNVRRSLGVCRQFKSKIQVLLLYISRRFARQWSSISFYIKTLCKAMVIDFLCHIEALCEAMVIYLFTSRPSARQWSLISYVTSRPSARQWSSISLHQDPLRGNGH